MKIELLLHTHSPLDLLLKAALERSAAAYVEEFHSVVSELAGFESCSLNQTAK